MIWAAGIFPEGTNPALLKTVEAIDTLLQIIGIELIITSAMRDPSENTKLGGLPNSLHLEGRALDFVIKEQSGTTRTRLNVLEFAIIQFILMVAGMLTGKRFQLVQEIDHNHIEMEYRAF